MKSNLLFEQLIAKEELSSEQMHEVIHDCSSGALNDSQIASFLALMRAKGETVQELTAAAQAMQELAHKIDLGPKLIDIVGTGGDGKNTFNISTACSFVLAAVNIKVAKHGNRSVSSHSGSADLLETAGFKLNLSDAAIKTCIEDCNIAFLFAPHYHPAMQKVRKARSQLGIRTLFNLIGPLINPAQIKRQVVGVFSDQLMDVLSSILVDLGSERHLIVHSKDGLDEISIAADTNVLEFHQGKTCTWTIHPEDYGLSHATLDAITVDSPNKSYQLIQAVFAGKKGPARDIVLLNSAAAIYCALDDHSFENALDVAKAAIDSGKVASCFKKLRLLTQSLK